MDEEMFQKIYKSIASSHRAFPNCRVASCDCNSNAGEWKVDCHCSCHWWQMPGGIDANWTLDEVFEEAKKGRQIDR